TAEIRRQLNLSQEQAEQIKCGEAPAPKGAPEIINQVVDQLAGELQRSLDFYLATSGDREIHQVYVSGGTAHLPSLRQALSRRGHRTVELLDPMKAVTPDPNSVDLLSLHSRACQAAVAIGLALRKERERRL